MCNYIRSTNIPFIVIANKADKIAVTKVNDAVEKIKKELNILAGTKVIPFSSERRIYTEQAWEEISKIIIYD
jgi:GTP-binding protein EngB required for normal cell division